ncbi:aminopeptidase N [Halieaceae bacterium IMCC14734]|uniref:Aminopeptidase N n=1 Tax=Candidatus Litorirhabdus singularis TaxID=2518993 RepID=A0ABT3TI65_9GAMM|nr:aminopeptidase N [Candidatus Litorirhabdus singularis]MCX2981694.1 aminopeptidase N [Candidatus Litorirhabdus singularis]
MKDAQAVTIYLKDYQAPAFLIDHTELDFQLYEDHALVQSALTVRRNPDVAAAAQLVLHGQELELLEVAIDGVVQAPGQFHLTEESLLLTAPGDAFIVTCRTRITPQDNTSLEGLYKSRTMFCTQCEAEGFRKITYYLDRPDVMSRFTVRLEAETAKYPVLLSNGNQTDGGVSGDRHWASWHDPFPKPAYLFALVAGDLESLDDSFVTHSGRQVQLRIFVEPKDLDKCAHAMDSLQRSMRWDEEKFGREYDLDIFNIVAVDDFNMGAMENKSLNIFNTSCVLAHPQTTTDAGFQRVEAVVAHEYFHNWSGNRVTCRDWFQLSLKEGFTVYRDAEFSADMGSRTVKRIEEVSMLRTVQFAEDAGPLAHPVRPDSFMEISNFYTVTIYEKGAEVVRMLRTLLGEEKFRAACDLYFERHDGEAVTCEDFVLAMEAVSGRDLSQFRRWYSQAGTPRLAVSEEWDAESGMYTLNFEQSCPPTPGQELKQPFMIPVALGLLGEAGALRLQSPDMPEDAETSDNTNCVLELTQPQQSFRFGPLPERPVPSLLRGFSAPVKMSFDYRPDQLAFLLSHDDDGFNRWEAAQRLAVNAVHAVQLEAVEVDQALLNGLSNVLADVHADAAMVAEILRLPAENTLAELVDTIDVDGIHSARGKVREAVARHLQDALLERYHALAASAAYAPTAAQMAARALRNTCLSYIAVADPERGVALAQQQFEGAENMTDRHAALVTLVHHGEQSVSEAALDTFYAQFKDEPLVVNMWLQVQASAPVKNAIERVRQLLEHPAYDARNPNKIRALVGTFCNANPTNFHALDGSGYELLRETVVELNSSNPQIASRLLTPLTKWRRYDKRQQLMHSELQTIAALPDLSRDVYEVVAKSL